jgi:hypothetical protein
VVEMRKRIKNNKHQGELSKYPVENKLKKSVELSFLFYKYWELRDSAEPGEVQS